LGESWVIGNMFRHDGFKIQEALLGVSPLGANDQIAYYSSAAIPAIRMDALVYFSLSVFWRASVRMWRGLSGRIMEGIELGPFEESIRRFLLGGDFPVDTVILISVWPTKDVLPAAYTPRRGHAPGWHVFNFLIPGLEFKLLTGRQIPRILREMCSHASRERFIYSAISVLSETTDAFISLMKRVGQRRDCER